MTYKPEFGGYIVFDAENGNATGIIYGRGPTSDEAWADFIREMEMARIKVVGEIDDDHIECEWPDQTPANRYRIIAASKRLIQEIEQKGGDLGWSTIDGIACGSAEVEEHESEDEE